MSIRKKGNGYEVRVYAGIDPLTGKERRYHKRVPTLREARRVEAELKRQVQESNHTPAAQLTLGQHLVEWLELETKPNTKHRTYERYEQLVRLHIEPLLGSISIDKLTPKHVAGLLATKRQEGLSARTCLQIYRVLHRALKVAVQWGMTSRNVCDSVEAPRVDEVQFTVLEPEHIEAILTAAEEERLGVMYLTAIKTGMRLGELAGLRWQDIDFNRNVLIVSQALEKSGLKPVFSTPKNRQARQVPMSDSLAAALRDLQMQQRQEREFFGHEYVDYDLVFAQPNGRPIDPRSFTRWNWKRVRSKAGLGPEVRFHDLRHTFISRALQAGANPRAVSEIVGHHDPGFTLKKYAHVTLKDTQEAVHQLERYLNSQQMAHHVPSCEQSKPSGDGPSPTQLS